jgi:hypothetical protein
VKNRINCTPRRTVLANTRSVFLIAIKNIIYRIHLVIRIIRYGEHPKRKKKLDSLTLQPSIVLFFILFFSHDRRVTIRNASSYRSFSKRLVIAKTRSTRVRTQNISQTHQSIGVLSVMAVRLHARARNRNVVITV